MLLLQNKKIKLYSKTIIIRTITTMVLNLIMLLLKTITDRIIITTTIITDRTIVRTIMLRIRKSLMNLTVY